MPHIHHNALLTQTPKLSKPRCMMKRQTLTALVVLVATAACGDSTNKQTSGSPVHMACTTPEQAGLKAADITRKLVEQKKQGTISPEQYATFNSTMSQGFTAWADRQDLKSYCAALNRVVKDASLQ